LRPANGPDESRLDVEVVGRLLSKRFRYGELFVCSLQEIGAAAMLSVPSVA